MEVEILKGQLTARDVAGNIRNVEGIEILEYFEGKLKDIRFYKNTSKFYLACAAEGTKSRYKASTNGIILL